MRSGLGTLNPIVCTFRGAGWLGQVMDLREGEQVNKLSEFTLAGYCLDTAEWAVVRAEFARADADVLMAKR